MSDKRAHSEGYLTDVRDFWWNQDFILLMAKRWNLNEIKSVLDVGCGVGHWGQMLLQHMSSNAHLTGIDPEEKWVAEATQRAITKGQDKRSEYLLGTAENIPFPDNSFDMVTCQTVLIHVNDASIAIQEMLRVLKPGGLLAVSEPNNMVSNLVFNNLNLNQPIDEILDIIRFKLICDKGKASLHEGYNSLGDVIPYYFANAGLVDIKIYLSDLADYFIPPYNSDREKFIVSSSEIPPVESWENEKKYHERYFLAGGGLPEEFTPLWKSLVNKIETKIKGIKNNNYYTSGGEMLYLISGRKC